MFLCAIIAEEDRTDMALPFRINHLALLGQMMVALVPFTSKSQVTVSLIRTFHIPHVPMELRAN